MIKTFVNKHTDLLEILLAGGGGFGLMLTDIELVLKVLIGIATLSYICFKFYCNVVDRFNKK